MAAPLLRVKRAMVPGQAATVADGAAAAPPAAAAAAKPAANNAKSGHVGHGHTAFLTRQGGPMAVAWVPDTTDLYLLGTDDGIIHKCSTSYNDQVLVNFAGHTGAVYTVKPSPHEPGLFLSASADWTVRVWRDPRLAITTVAPVHTLTNPSKRAFADAAWSAAHPDIVLSLSCVVFGSVLLFLLLSGRPVPLIHSPSPSSRGSTMLAWSLSSGQADPLVSAAMPAPLTRVVSAGDETILLGDAAGTVHVTQLVL